MTCEVRGARFALPVKAARREPEDAFDRIENLRAMNLKAVRGRIVLKIPHTCDRFAFCPSALRVRRGYGLLSG